MIREDEEFNCEENKYTEFKAHDRISYNQLTIREVDGRLFQPASRTLCAFLNSNKTCKLYLGIKDDATVTGHHMFQAQKEHFILSLKMAFSEQFSPPVDEYRYSVKFIKVQPRDPSSEYVNAQALTIKSDHELLSKPNICWCDKEINRHKRSLKKPPLYVIEVTIHEWNLDKDSQGFKIWPYFTNEEQKCYKRYMASNQEVSQEEVINVTLNHDLNELKEIIKSSQCGKVIEV